MDNNKHTSSTYILPILSFSATLILTIIGSEIIGLSSFQKYVVFSVGASITFAVALIDKKIEKIFLTQSKMFKDEFKDSLEIYRLLNNIDDVDLQNEIIGFARQISSGEIPRHMSAVRIPQLYYGAKYRIYASNVSLTKENLMRWINLARFKTIVNISKLKTESGVMIERTFVLSRAEMIDNGNWIESCWEVIENQLKAGITVRVLWIEDVNSDVVSPARKVDRDFTIFDDSEIVDRGDIQLIYRLPSKKVHDFIDLRNEQLKYAETISI